MRLKIIDDKRKRRRDQCVELLFAGKTIREIASETKLSKSTVFNYLHSSSKDKQTYEKILFFLEKNRSEAHIRGGEATKRRYAAQKLLES